MLSFPTHLAGIPLWGILLGIVGLTLFFLKVSGESTNQDRYPTAKLFAYIIAIFFGVVGLIDFIRWANLW